MGTGYTRADTGNNIADGNIISAADLDGEFDAVQAAFDASTGHTHDGTTAEGAPIAVTGPTQEYVSTATELRPKTNNTYDLGSATNQWKDLYVDGTANLDAVDIDGGNIDGTVIGAATPAAGTFTTAAATTGNITTVNATTVDTTNLEVTSLKAKDGTAAGSIADSTGVVTLASSVLTTTDINGGTIDGVTIGGAVAGAITGTTGTFSGDLSLADKIVHTGDTNTAIRFPANDTVTVETSGSERMRITSAGNVGIGTSSPASALDVAGNINTTQATYNSVQVNSGTVQGQFAANGSGSLNIRAVSDHPMGLYTNNTERMRIDSAGNVGIGTTSPGVRFVISSSSPTSTTEGFRVQNTESGAQFDLIATGTTFSEGGWLGASDAAILRSNLSTSGGLVMQASAVGAPIRFGTGLSERMRITATGDVGIGTSSPAARLNVLSSSATEPAVRITQTGAGDALVVEDSTSPDATPFVVASDGRVRVLHNATWSGITDPAVAVDANQSAAFAQTFYAYNAASPILSFVTGGGTTFGANDAVAAGRQLGTMRFYGTDGTAPILAAQIQALVDGTPGTNDMPGRLVFSTTADGASSTTERMRITSTGNVGIGRTNPATLLDVNGDVTITDKIIHSGDTNTAIRFPAADTVTVETNGAERLRVGSTGLVGVGTDNPSYRLDVATVGGSIARFSNGSSGATPSTTHGELIVESGEANLGVQILGTATSNQKILFGDTGSNGAGQLVYDHTSDFMAFHTNAAERVRITSAGNVGILTTTPATPLDVNGDVTITDKIIHSGDTNTAIRFPADDTVTVETAGSERMRVTSTGFVGIGTSSPASKLHVLGAGTPVRVQGSTGNVHLGDNLNLLDPGTVNDGAIYFGTTSASDPTAGIEASWGGATNPQLHMGITRATGGSKTRYSAFWNDSSLRMYTSDNERMRVTSAGNVGIGTTTPATPLDVNGDVTITDKIIHSGDTNTAIRFPAADTVTVETAGSERMRIDLAGRVGIGTSTPQRPLHIADTAPTIVLQETDQATDESRWRVYIDNSDFFVDSINDAISAAEPAYRIIRGDGIAVSGHTWSTAQSERMRITSTGNVGIGRTNPATLLDVNGDVTITDKIIHSGDTDTAIRFPANDTVTVETAGSERMRIASTGNVGINETAPDYRLDVNGTFGFTPGASVTPVDNGDVVFELTNNTTLTVKAKGSDGVVRSGTITLA